MFGGLTFDKLLIVGVIAVFLLGPERLPHYAAQLGKMVRTLRDLANGARDRVREEMGPEFDDVDWKKLDPRQYDPRRIIREALSEADPFKTPVISRTDGTVPSITTSGTVKPPNMESIGREPLLEGGADKHTVFDSEAT